MMDDQTGSLQLGELLIGGLLALTGAVLAGSWLLGKIAHDKGHNQQAPVAGSVSSEHHHQTPPGR